MSLDKSALRQNDVRQNNVLDKMTSLDKMPLDETMLHEMMKYRIYIPIYITPASKFNRKYSLWHINILL
jgi:hypothetical protein